jgi:hypothetical protein
MKALELVALLVIGLFACIIVIAVVYGAMNP